MSSQETYNRIVTIGVDIQNDFCPGGALGVTDGDTIIGPFNNVTEWTRQQGYTVALTRDWHPTQTSHFDQWPPHCIADTEGAALHPDLTVDASDIILNKGTGPNDDAYSGFEATVDGVTLEEIIAPRRNDRLAILVGGLATDYCVKATVLDAVRIANHQTDVYLITDAIKAVNLQPGDDKQAINEMQRSGARLITSQQILSGEIKVEG